MRHGGEKLAFRQIGGFCLIFGLFKFVAYLFQRQQRTDHAEEQEGGKNAQQGAAKNYVSSVRLIGGEDFADRFADDENQAVRWDFIKAIKPLGAINDGNPAVIAGKRAVFCQVGAILQALAVARLLERIARHDFTAIPDQGDDAAFGQLQFLGKCREQFRADRND
ncbi:MAG: hypothetical protein ACD_10C00485G0003 [uncultured bacterium]|nr:MAG: hypothetical protein ACD_10C00485G0003 [uncultured bacterium]